MNGSRHWSTAEIALLSDLALSDSDIANRTGRSIQAVAAQRRRRIQKRAMRLGLYPFQRRPAEPERHAFIVLRHLPEPT
ncbi:Uncharacterised protein [Mycobacteroides abscessus subsp. bolletii]|nr:Uncharacterised protein [Mycobacteroides abscessus subsp. bolletii]SKF73771.1 Uncharacterised protein [Mycobacteroides abscessus subsp. bolletii]SPX82481.1 Uncharacterised protein [Mycobacteroides abscessus]